jgi:site-specific recombinase XerD
MNKDYKIDRSKFFDYNEREIIMLTCEKENYYDLAKGRMTWPIRYMLVDLAFNSGLRVAEIAALTVEDVKINLREPYIFVRNGKRSKSRDVYIDKELVRRIHDFLKKKRNWNQSIEPQAPFFAGQGGKPYSTTALSISFKMAVRKAGLRDELSIHSARHTYATILYHKTKDLRLVQKQLGHSTLNMSTLYADIMPEEQSRLANKILD